MKYLLCFLLFTCFFIESFADIGYFLHITDIHYDPLYHPGSPNNCLIGNTGLGCCHKYDIPIKPYHPANKWGDISCDTSYLFVNKTFEWIANNLNPIDFIIYTGDSVNHHDITQSVSFNIKSINDINNLFISYFPNKTVYSSIGNHDTYPIDQTESHLNTYFLKNFANEWTNWLPNSSYNTINKGGYYSIEISPNMYIINFNSLYFDSNNLFTKNVTYDYANQWEWFNNTLYDISRKNGNVWIVNHICPFLSEAREYYSNKFIEIINNYKNIIKYQFYGHVHQDIFTLFSYNKSIIGAASIPSSLMLDNHEASFRIYEYDDKSYDILNYHQYISDLKNIIKYDKIIYHKSYSFNEEYKLNGVNTDNWMQLYLKINNDSQLLNKYYNHINPGNNYTNCNISCKKIILKNIFKTI